MGAIAIETKKMGELDRATAVGVNDLVLIHTAEGMRVCTVKALLDGGGIDIPIATTAAAGIVKPDGTTILIKADGTLSAAIQEVNVATAAAAGIVPGDIITAFDGQPVESASDLMLDVRTKNPGDTVTLTVNSGGQSKDVQVTLGDDAASQQQKAETQQESMEAEHAH